MNCSCSAMYMDVEGYFTSRHRKAAKEHVCPECKGIIKKGDKYLFSTLFYEGGIQNSKMCASCESIVYQFFQDGYYIGQVWDDLAGYLDSSWSEDLPSECVVNLHPDAKDAVCDILQRYQD